ncbi:MAG: hypothetical protein E7271_02045 [Lachnospiraceae bacterium]|nr:hypothetical protein [Lachnospiraceae bacterium]
MKNNEAAIAFFKSMPKKTVAQNPYYTYDDDYGIKYSNGKMFAIEDSLQTLVVVREYFKRVFESFGTEAQILLVSRNNGDDKKLQDIIIPEIAKSMDLFFADVPVAIFVLPQVNTNVTSSVSEKFWQQYIIGNDIVPVARIHSHYVLDAYQSATDYSTLNSGSLEMVLGHINDEMIHVAYWLDEKGKDTKENVFVVEGDKNEFRIKKIPSGKPLE